MMAFIKVWKVEEEAELEDKDKTSGLKVYFLWYLWENQSNIQLAC